MSLYFDSPVQFSEAGVISTHGAWHPSAPLLAIGSYSQERGGFVTIFDELGEPLKDITFPVHPVSQVTAVAWHPERNILACSWESGEIRTWNGTDKEFTIVNGPHTAPVNFLAFSEKGSRLVSADASGSLVGWKVDTKGQTITSFHHDLKDSVTHLTFRLTTRNPEIDIEGLAKAAVNGDETALDIFSDWRPRTTARQFRIHDGNDNQCFFVGTQSGLVYYINQNGNCVEVLNTEGLPLAYMLYHPTKDSLVIMREGFSVEHFLVDTQGHLTELARVKLSGKAQSMRSANNQGLVWAGNSALAILTGELTVRIWDVDTNDNYILPIYLKSYGTEDKSKQFNEMFMCISYCKVNQTLCAGTNLGQIYFWVKKQTKTDYIDNPEETWTLSNINNVNGTIKQLMWGSVNLRLPLIAVNCITKVYVLKEQSLSTCHSENIWATQKTATQILLETPIANYALKTDIQVTGMSLTSDFIAITNGRVVTVYSIQLNNSEENYDRKKKEPSIITSLLGNFNCDNEKIIMYGKNIIALTANGIVIKSPNNLTVATIPIINSEGEPIGMHLTNNFLSVFTMDGYLKVYDLTTREPKLVTPVRNLYDMCADFGEIIQAKANSNGNKIALTLAAANLIPDGKVYVWDIDTDSLVYYDFRNKNEGGIDDDDDVEKGDGDAKKEGFDEMKINYDKICADRIPISIHWDTEDTRLLICDAKTLKPSLINNNSTPSGRQRSGKINLETCDHIIITMFISSEHGIRIQDIRPTEPNSKLIAVCTPHIITLDKLSITRHVMHDFLGLENCDKSTREAVLDFSFNLSLGNMDAAFKAIKSVQSTGVWTSLAKMCVKTRRLDVAGVCLGHMKNARAAGALRKAVADKTLPQEAKVAVLAIQLGLLDEAEQLYISCERYDLLNKLYQCRNKMESAVTIAETKDRIHLRSTEYVWGKALEEAGDLTEAITKYENANTHRYNVPRMLVDTPKDLETYIIKSNDNELIKWWGQYVESLGEMATAYKFYEQAGDIYSQVRALCFLGDESKAAELAKSATNKAACYHMARHYETNGNIDAAVGFFIKANAYSNAVRLCKETNMTEELWNIGMVANRREKLECAKYFEENNQVEKSVLFYHRAGMLHKALDLAYKTQQYDALQQMTSDLDANSDPALVEKCAEYFITNQQYDKAVDLLAIAKKYIEALDVCLKHNIQLTEQLAEHLTPDKDQTDEQTRTEVLQKVGECLFSQGNYHLATKKFTQAGDKIRAMKALLKSGDTDKIIFFAGVSRQREIYIMAANYLQSLDWQNDSEVLKNIITFYSKGKAMDLLANFYVACAQVEIDEFQNYEKALGAMNEAARCLNKVTTPRDANVHQRAMDIVQTRTTNIKRFVDIRRLYEHGDHTGGMNQCRTLLLSGGEDLEQSVRRGDIYALMIQNCIKIRDFDEAKKLVDELQQILGKSGNASLSYYLSKELIEILAQGLGIPISSIIPPIRKNDDDDVEEEIQEEVEE